MQVNQENLQRLSSIFQSTLSPDSATRKQAEDQLKKIESQRGFVLLLVALISNESVPESLRLVASVFFKNFIKKQWKPTVQESFLNEEERTQIKKHIVQLMLSTKGKIREQLSEVVTTIATHDFFKNWTSLIEELVSQFKSSDFSKIHGVLYTAHSIFKRYRNTILTEELIDEIQYVIQGFGQPMLTLFQGLCGMIPNASQNKQQLTLIFECLILLLEVFYSLNWLDLPEFFEDNVKTFMAMFHTLLTYQNPLLASEDEEQPGKLDEAKTLICEIINIYLEKYGEDFGPFVETFTKDIWELLMKTGLESKYDRLVSKAIYFLTIVSKSEKHGLFNNPQALQSICNQVVIPNISLRESDMELFEDDPIEYIRRDIEGSDSDTRRRSAIELVKGLCVNYDAQVTPILLQKVQELLKKYSENPSANWKAKDIAFYLYTSVAVKAKTQKKGTTKVHEMINVLEFFQNAVLPELKNPNTHPILQADSIKFATTFRLQIPKNAFPALFPLFIKYLESPQRVVHTYAAWAIERFLFVKEEKNQPRYTKNDIQPFTKDLLTNLFKALTHKESSENEYVMKAIMRVTTILKEEMAPYMGVYIQSLTNILAQVCSNPKNPTFNHYIFESYATVIRYNPQAVESFEKALFPPFQSIVQQNVEEFTPYVFQIMAQLLEIRQPPVPKTYIGLFPNLLVPLLWENTGNIPGLVRLIGSIIKKAPNEVSGKNLQSVLGIFQKLVVSKTLDHEGFYILNSLIESLKPEEFQQFFPTILSILFTRLQKSRTGKFVKMLILFMSLFCVKHGPTLLVTTIEKMQSQLFIMLTPQWTDNVQKVTGKIERKICAVALVKLLCETPILLNDPYFEVWGRYLMTLMKLLELPEDQTGDESEDSEEPIPVEYRVKYQKLSYAHKEMEDPTSNITNVKQYVAQSLNNLLQTSGQKQKIVAMIIKVLPPNVLNVLASYFSQAGLNPQVLSGGH